MILKVPHPSWLDLLAIQYNTTTMDQNSDLRDAYE